MKKLTTYVFTLAGLLIACENETSLNQLPQEEEYNIRFCFQPHPELFPFYSTKSMPGNIPSEPTAAENSGNPPDKLPFTFIEYVVYDLRTDTLVHHQTFTEKNSEENEFGIYLYDKLKEGEYQVHFLAHSIEEREFINKEKFTFQEVGDTFYASEKIKIENSNGMLVDILLKRKVARIEFTARDTVPDNLSSIQIATSGRYTTFNIPEGKADELTTVYQVTHPIQAQPGTTNLSHGFFTFVPTDSTLIAKVDVTSFDNNDKIIRKRAIKDIPIYINRITRYTATLYHSIEDDIQFDLEIDDQWGKEINNNISD